MFAQFSDPSKTAVQRFENANIASFKLFKKILTIVYPNSTQGNMTSLLENFIRNLPEKSIKHQKLSAILSHLYQYQCNEASLERWMGKVESIIEDKGNFCQNLCGFFRKDKILEQVGHLFQYSCG